MSKVTPYQRQERMQAPYTISRPVTGSGNKLINLIGVMFEEKFEDEEWKVVRTEYDLGTYESLLTCSVEGAKFREDPEGYYTALLAKRAAEEAEAA